MNVSKWIVSGPLGLANQSSLHILVSLSREGDEIDFLHRPTPPKVVVYNAPEKEIAYGPACYLVCFAT